jgi:hypothetical protein
MFSIEMIHNMIFDGIKYEEIFFIKTIHRYKVLEIVFYFYFLNK